jgi:regulator of sirC expression with transglutaminase-like and TPR domain
VLACDSSTAAEKPNLLDRLLQLEAAHGSLCAEVQPTEVVRAEISAVGGRLRERLESVGKEAGSRDHASRAVAALNDAVFNDLGIHPSQDLHDPCNLLLSGVLARKQAYCVGIAAVYLILAEQLNLPVFAVATPSHVFLRYDDGKARINIETFQRGTSVPDEQYVAEQRIARSSISRGIFLRPLTADEFLAQVHNNLGVVYSHQQNYAGAAPQYKSALDLHPDMPAAWYNCGNDLLQQGDYKQAIRYFSRALRLNPNDVWAFNNRGLAYRSLGKEEKATQDFGAALRVDPAFDMARQNLADPPR